MRVTGTDIHNFFLCSLEKSRREAQETIWVPPSIPPLVWGTLCEDILRGLLRVNAACKLQDFTIVQDLVNSRLPSLNISQTAQVISNLERIFNIIVSMHQSTLSETNIHLKTEDYSVQIDFIMKTKFGERFPVELKSTSSPGYFAYNSDIAQLTVQNIVLESVYNQAFDYGQIIYIGDGRVVEMITRPFNQCINGAKLAILKHKSLVDCNTCEMPCYQHVR